MHLIWLSPIAWLGLLTLAVPVAIHLLTRQTARRVPFPSLRFVRTTRLAALRRRSIQDWWLLAVRMAMLTAATAALAAPVLISPARERAWKSRVASAFVIAPVDEVDRREPHAIVEAERKNSFASAVFTPDGHVADGIRDAARWLEAQRAGSREVVIVGDLRLGRMSAGDLTSIPEDAGIRFLPLPPARVAREAERGLLHESTRWRAHVSLLDTTTRVSYARDTPGAPPIAVRAAANDRAFASAALDAVLARGITTPGGRRLIVVFAGGSTRDLELTTPPAETWMREALAALPGMTGAQHREALVVETGMAAAGVQAVRALERAANAAFAEAPSREPVPIAPDVLARWSRPIGAARDFQPEDEGDRRWMWAAALLLLALEMVIRRRRIANGAEPLTAPEERVA